MLPYFTMKSNFHIESILVPVLLLSMIWIVFLIQYFGYFNDCFGIIPLETKGLKGILFAPLFHANWQHLFNNSLTLFVLMFMAFQFYRTIAYYVLIVGWIFTGVFVWFIPDFDFINAGFYSSCHIGASGLIYVFAFFLAFSGIFARDVKLAAVSLVVIMLYGGMIWGIFPQEFFLKNMNGERISWQSHLGGAITGTILAIQLRKFVKVEKKLPSWEQSNYNKEKDEELWNTYKENFPEDFAEEPENKEIKNPNNHNATH